MKMSLTETLMASIRRNHATVAVVQGRASYTHEAGQGETRFSACTGTQTCRMHVTGTLAEFGGIRTTHNRGGHERCILTSPGEWPLAQHAEHACHPVHRPLGSQHGCSKIIKAR